MSGARGVRGGRPLEVALMSERFRAVQAGCVERSGYLFRIYLPGPGGTWIRECSEGGFGPGDVAPAGAEKAWCCYAWPKDPEFDTSRTFFVNQEGDMFASEGYAGANAPGPEAALPQDGGEATDRYRGRDGRTWKQCG